VALEDDWAEARALLGYLCRELGYAEEAAEHYRTALRLDPRWPEVASERAWQMVTGPDLTPWKAAVALLYARQACQATEERRSDFLETRAAAEASAGRYSQAAQTLRKALTLLTKSADPDRYRALEQRLRRYEQLGP
jgi:Flp pilus assembly protein TadD